MRFIGFCSSLLFLFPIVFGLTNTVNAQGEDDPSCPIVMNDALFALEQNCVGLQRNSVCYGYNRVVAAFQQAQAENVFSSPADRVELELVRSLQTAPLSVEQSIWGLAVMNVQANIPNTVPGQGVTMVLVGDASLNNQVDAADALAAADPVTARVTANQGLNIRSGPGTDYNVLGTVASGAQIDVEAFDLDEEWVRVIYGGGPGWASASFVRALETGAFDDLPRVQADALSPMQAFTLTTGIGEPQCRQAPDMLLIQGPRNVQVNLNVNGAELRIGSTVVLQTTADDTASAAGISADGLPIDTPFYVLPVDEDTLVVATGVPLQGGIPLQEDIFIRPVDAENLLLTAGFDETSGLPNSGGIYIDPRQNTILTNVAFPPTVAGVTFDGAIRVRSQAGTVAFAVDPNAALNPQQLIQQPGQSAQVTPLNADEQLAAVNPVYLPALNGELQPTEASSAPPQQPSGCVQTELIVLDGEADLNSGQLDVIIGHSAMLETCYAADGSISNEPTWEDGGRVSAERLADFAIAESISAELLHYGVQIPTDSEIDLALNPPTPVPPSVPNNNDDDGNTATATAEPIGTGNVDCTGFVGTSPTDGMNFGPQPFYWDAPLGRDQIDYYQVVVNATDRGGQASNTVSGATNLQIDMGVGVLDAFGRGLNFVWRVDAYQLNGNDAVLACSTPPVNTQREFISPPELCRLLGGNYDIETCFGDNGVIIPIPD